MIHFNFQIQNIFKRKPWTNVFSKTHQLTKNKTLEIEYSKYGYNLFLFSLDLRFSGFDHAGPNFEISMLGYELRIAIYDVRHWDQTNNRWEEHNNEHTNC